jgi:hypothetical protein
VTKSTGKRWKGCIGDGGLWPGGQIFDLAGVTNTAGALSFAFFAKGGQRCCGRLTRLSGCGIPVRRQTMARVASIIVSFAALALLLSSCGGGAGSSGGGGGGGGASGPSITQLAPSSIMVGIPQGGITVFGKGFTSASQVLMDGQPLSTTLTAPGMLTAQLGIYNGLPVGTHQFTVENGTQLSNSATFTIYAPQQGPFPMQTIPGFMVGTHETNPTFIVAADVNGDGLADVIMPGPGITNSASIAILNGQADGTLSAPQYIPVPVTPFALAVGDVDGNGTPDLVTVTGDNLSTTTVSVLEGDGHGNFQPPVVKQTVTAPSPNIAFLADLDGDGQLDLVLSVSNPAGISSTIVWLKNTGGSFAAPVTLTTNSTGRFSIADFNVDGKPDILYTTAPSGTGSQAVHILFNQGNGKFKDQAAGVNVGNPLTQFTVIDSNLDGIPDLVMTYPLASGSQFVSFLGNGDGSFTQVSSMTTPPLTQLVVGDFDHDGFPDLAGPGGSGPTVMAYFFGDGHGNFTFQQMVGPFGQFAAVGDFNGDGLPDIVVPDEFALVSLTLGRTDRNFPFLLTLFPATMTGVSAGDINGDGLPEIMVGGNNYGGANIPGTVFLNQGNSSFTFGAYTSSDTGVLADLNGKALADLLGGPVGTLEVWPNNGTLDFSAPPFTVPNANGLVAIADMDGDGCPDIVANGQVFYGNCAYQFTPIALPNSPGGPYVVGDFTGNGKLDIVDGTVTHLNTGNRTFQTVMSSNLQMGEGAIFAVGDFNGDGKADVAVSLPNETWITIYYSNGDGTFYEGTQLDPGQEPVTLVAGDFVGDGQTGLAVGLILPYEVCMLFPSGQGQFTRSFFAVGVLTAAMTASDLNKNGKLDLVIGNFVFDFTPANVVVVFHK